MKMYTESLILLTGLRKGWRKPKKIAPKNCSDANDHNCAVWLVGNIWNLRVPETGTK